MQRNKQITDEKTVLIQESWDIENDTASQDCKDEQIAENAIFTCAFTGHRSILPEHRRELSDRLSRTVNYLYSRGCRIFYCGGALGFDTLAAREIIKLSLKYRDVRLRLVLPCQNQDDRWSEGQKDAYNYILKNAEHTEYVADTYSSDCMRKRNLRLCELGDVLVAYLYRQKSGAGQTVRIAKSLGKTVYNLAPDTSEC